MNSAISGPPEQMGVGGGGVLFLQRALKVSFLKEVIKKCTRKLIFYSYYYL